MNINITKVLCYLLGAADTAVFFMETHLWSNCAALRVASCSTLTEFIFFRLSARVLSKRRRPWSSASDSNLGSGRVTLLPGHCGLEADMGTRSKHQVLVQGWLRAVDARVCVSVCEWVCQTVSDMPHVLTWVEYLSLLVGIKIFIIWVWRLWDHVSSGLYTDLRLIYEYSYLDR